jgi:hypothetical protein
MTVAELEERMSYAELLRWAEYEKHEPFLGERLELGFALVASVIANVNRAKGKPQIPVESFMPYLEADRRRAEEVAARERANMPDPANDDDAVLQRLVLQFGGTVV